MRYYLLFLLIIISSRQTFAQDYLAPDYFGMWLVTEVELIDLEGHFEQYCKEQGFEYDELINEMESLYVGVMFNFKNDSSLIITNSPESEDPVEATYHIIQDGSDNLIIENSAILSGKPYKMLVDDKHMMLIYYDLNDTLEFRFTFTRW